MISVNAAPGTNERALFEEYMENGGGWIGFHAAEYIDPTQNLLFINALRWIVQP